MFRLQFILTQNIINTKNYIVFIEISIVKIILNFK